MIDSICINRTKDEFARYMWMLNAYSHRFRRVHVDNIVPNSLYRGGCRAHTHWFVDQRIEQGSPAYLGLACSRATSYVTHNSTNSITKFEVIQARQPASNSFHPQLLSLDYVSSDDKLHGTYLEALPPRLRWGGKILGYVSASPLFSSGTDYEIVEWDDYWGIHWGKNISICIV